MAECHIVSQEKYGYDGCVIDFDDASIAEAIGAKVIYRDDEPAIVDESQPLLRDLRQIYDMEVPDIYSAGRLNEWLEATRILRERIGDHVFIMGRADQGPFSIACLLRGTTQFMMDLMMENKRLIDDVLEYCRQVSLAFAKAQKDAGAHATSIGDALAGPNLISPQMFREFALEPERRLTQEVQAYGIPFSIHICGDTSPILEDMADCGYTTISIDNKVDLEDAKRRIGNRAFLVGNVDPVNGFYNGTPRKMKAAVRKCFRQCWDSPCGFMIAPGCGTAYGTPMANALAYMEEARRCAKYPVNPANFEEDGIL